jgi:hypothetical protein
MLNDPIFIGLIVLVIVLLVGYVISVREGIYDWWYRNFNKTKWDKIVAEREEEEIQEQVRQQENEKKKAAKVRQRLMSMEIGELMYWDRWTVWRFPNGWMFDMWGNPCQFIPEDISNLDKFVSLQKMISQK